MALFRGFSSLQYPVYSVITPQTGLQFETRALNVSEVDKIKHSMITSIKANDILNKIIWGALETKPDHIKTYDSFLKNITTIDREALVYGVYISTFDDKRDLQLECRNPDCGKVSKVSVMMSKMFSMNPYPVSKAAKDSYKMAKAVDKDSTDIDVERIIEREEAIVGESVKKKNKVVKFIDDEPANDKQVSDNVEPEESIKKDPILENIIQKRIEVPLITSDKIVAIIRQPTLWDLDILFKTIPFTKKEESTVAHETLLIERFEERIGSSPMVVEDREDIIEAYNSLPPKDKKKIFDVFSKEFGRYTIDISTNWKCPECGTDDKIEVDITSHFFRMVSGS